MKRRDFLKAAALAASSGMVLPALAQQQVRKPCLHLFTKMLQWLGPDEMADAAVKMGFAGIDLLVRPKGCVEPENVQQDLPRWVEAAHKRDLKLDMIVTAIVSADEPHTEQVLKTAAQCGVKYYRMGYLYFDKALGIEGSVQKFHKQMAALEKLNRSCGIVGCYQNHYAWDDSLFGGAVWDVYYMLKGLDPQWVGCQYDVRHAMAESGGSWANGMRLIAPYIRSTCLKDFHWAKKDGRWKTNNVFAGDGMVPWDKYFKLAKELNIGGPASVQCEWELFTPEEQKLPEAQRIEIALRKIGKDHDFFAEKYEKFGLACE